MLKEENKEWREQKRGLGTKRGNRTKEREHKEGEAKQTGVRCMQIIKQLLANVLQQLHKTMQTGVHWANFSASRRILSVTGNSNFMESRRRISPLDCREIRGVGWRRPDRKYFPHNKERVRRPSAA